MTESAEKNFPAYSHLPKKNDCLVIFDSGNGDLKENKIFFA
ncbi:hypothetical protein AC96_1171 [Escherichia coli 2-156-04_S4_C2]|nr:2-keto-3-deoxy-D-arabino-heptulosonate-7-phosphate synthase I alpha [Escherichia coli SCD1]KDX36020.1 hypothetical protein AC96_1171 [Escherichia coli 2-156-04_S4_C2]